MGGTFEKVPGFAQAFENKNVTDPNQAQWGDLSGGEKGARLTSGIIQGFNNGMQSRQQPMRPGGGAQPIQVAQTPQLQNQFDPNYLMNRQQPPTGPRGPFGGNSPAFYGR